MAKKETCRCNPPFGLIALIISVVGFYSIILGIKIQLLSPRIFNNWWAMLSYLIGILLIAIAKISRHCAFNKCEMHKMK